MLTLYAFRWVPEFARGLVRDLRVRWALEEAGQPYEVKLLGFDDTKTGEYKALQPFSQIPAVAGDAACPSFESGAIVLQIAEQSDALLPSDPARRAEAKAWLFAAINSVEPFFFALIDADAFHADKPWAKEMRPMAEERALSRLGPVEAHLADGRDYLAGHFSAADILMTTVLRELRHTDYVARFPRLDAYLRRCEERPAFRKALADQLAAFEAADQVAA